MKKEMNKKFAALVNKNAEIYNTITTDAMAYKFHRNSGFLAHPKDAQKEVASKVAADTKNASYIGYEHRDILSVVKTPIKKVSVAQIAMTDTKAFPAKKTAVMAAVIRKYLPVAKGYGKEADVAINRVISVYPRFFDQHIKNIWENYLFPYADYALLDYQEFTDSLRNAAELAIRSFETAKLALDDQTLVATLKKYMNKTVYFNWLINIQNQCGFTHRESKVLVHIVRAGADLFLNPVDELVEIAKGAYRCASYRTIQRLQQHVIAHNAFYAAFAQKRHQTSPFVAVMNHRYVGNSPIRVR